MRVGYFPYGAANPYQTLFYDAVEAAGAEVVALPVRALFPLRDVHGVDIVHLDWLHPFYASRRGRVFGRAKLETAMHHLRQASRRGRPGFVHTIHNIVTHDSYLPLSYEKKLVGRMMASMHGLAGFSDPVFDELDRHYDLPNHQRRFVIPHGNYVSSYDAPPTQSASRLQLSLPPETPVVLFFGSLRENKGILDLLRVFPEVHRKTGAMLIVAGTVASSAVSEALTASTANDGVRVLEHHIPDADVPVLFAAADLVALPFRSILNSGSAILAASMGRFVVLPDIATLQAGLLSSAVGTFEANNPESLRASLIRTICLPRKQLHALGAQSREHVEVELAWSGIGSRAMYMYQDVLSSL